MESKLTEKATEQKYFDNAAEHRQRHREELGKAGGAAAHPRAAGQIRKQVEPDPAEGERDEAVAVGRIDAEDDRLYIGRQLIRDDEGEILVIGWQAPAAARYYEASRDNPLGVSRKRTYECEANTILDFSDVHFTGDETADEFLLRELGRARTGAMSDIVATIQAAQFDVTRQSPDQVLIIEGGPGTGKTVIALHRVSWLLHNHPELRADGVLVVGPHPTFIRYIREVLPGLGEDEVELRDLGRLAPDVQRGRLESDEVARLKGDVRVAAVLARALGGRIAAPTATERIPVGNRFVSIPGADIAAVLDECRELALAYAGQRDVFRNRLADVVSARTGGQPPRGGAVANLVDRLWPPYGPAAFLHSLLGSRQRLAAAAGGDLTEAEVGLLYRRGSDRLTQEVWSDADLPMLDELDHLINGAIPRYAHVVVDEAQDLSPMQLRSLARRSAGGSMTIVGDIAQSTGAWARDGWDTVTGHLPQTYPVRLETLRYGYRVPRQAYEFASRLLPVAAADAQPPEVVREGPEPVVHPVPLEERAGRSVDVATAHAADGRFVGIVCPARCRREVEAALAARGVSFSDAERGELGAAINLVSPQETKGLEFDAVVVVEPEHIVAEHHRGHRMLYIALTRTTGHLDIVCVGDPLPGVSEA